MTEITDRPNPGSDEAVDKGCTCPIQGNRRGKGPYRGKNDIFWVDTLCPLHGRKKVEK